jgi:hypothetical protein
LYISGLKKKLVSLAKEKQCEDLQPWVKSICNHLYWVAASTPSNNLSEFKKLQNGMCYILQLAWCL